MYGVISEGVGAQAFFFVVHGNPNHLLPAKKGANPRSAWYI
jgi:hypothetical protein